MRIYEGDYTVRNILEDCEVNRRDSFAVHTAGRLVHGIDLDKLNRRLRTIPIDEIRKKRARMNVFYEEVLVSADPDRGISFTSCLMILAHYNVIDDTKSLRLDEFLKRRARLQRVHETIRRNVVIGFFDTMFWSRKFRRARNSHIDARMAGPPQLSVPEIFVDDPDESMRDNLKSMEPRDFTEPTPAISPRASDNGSSSGVHLRGLPKIDTTLRRKDSMKTSPTWEGERSTSPTPSPSLSPNRLLFRSDTAYRGFERSTEPGSPSRGHSRQSSGVSEVSAEGVMESFDNSAWGESIRKSFSMRRPSHHR